MPGAIGAAVIGLLGMTVAATSAAALVVGNIILGAAVFGAQMLLGRPTQPGIKPSDVQQEIRQPLSPRTKSYGRVRRSGVTFWLDSVQSDVVKNLYLGLALNHGRIAAIDQFHVDDNEVEIDGSGQVTTAPYSPHAELQYRLGEALETQYEELETVFNTPNIRGDGVASILGRFRNSADANQQMQNYPGGLPQLRVTMQASVCFDPREPLHDVADPTTWEWSENLGVIILNYLIDPDGYGMSYDRVLPNLDQWIEQLDICDEVQALADASTELRYRGAGTYDFTERPRDVITRMLAACDGRLWQKRDGSIGFTVGRFVEPTMTIESRDILSYKMERGQDPLSAIVGLRAQYTSPDHDYREHEAEAWPNGEAIVGLDEERIDTLDLLWSPSHGQTRRLMKREYIRRTAGWKGSISTNLAGLRALDERYIRVVIDELGIDESFEVGKFTLDPSTLRCQMELLAVDASIDDWDPETEETTASPPVEYEFQTPSLIGRKTVNSFSEPNVAFGAAAADRHAFIFIHGGADSVKTLTSATIGGVSATIHAQANHGSIFFNTALISAPLAVGTTATVDLTFQSGSAYYDVWLQPVRVTGLLSDTAIDTDTATGGGVSSFNLTLGAADGGVLLAGLREISGADNVAMTGVTEGYDLPPQSGTRIAGGGRYVGGNAGRTVTFARTGGSGTTMNYAGLAASFR